MHIERLTKLAEWLEAGGKHELVHFDMTSGIRFSEEVEMERLTPEEINACGSSCCIAGAAVQFFNNPVAMIRAAIEDNDMYDTTEVPWHTVKEEAAELLELDSDVASWLFEPNYYAHIVDHYNLGAFNDPAWAARTIRHLIATGEVNWKAMKEAPCASA